MAINWSVIRRILVAAVWLAIVVMAVALAVGAWQAYRQMRESDTTPQAPATMTYQPGVPGDDAALLFSPQARSASDLLRIAPGDAPLTTEPADLAAPDGSTRIAGLRRRAGDIVQDIAVHRVPGGTDAAVAHYVSEAQAAGFVAPHDTPPDERRAVLIRGDAQLIIQSAADGDQYTRVLIMLRYADPATPPD